MSLKLWDGIGDFARGLLMGILGDPGAGASPRPITVGTRHREESNPSRRDCDPDPRSNEDEKAGTSLVRGNFREKSHFYLFGVEMLFWCCQVEMVDVADCLRTMKPAGC